jgi:FkbM family methyltransferase
VPQFVSYAQNGEDVRIWHAFGPKRFESQAPPLTFVEVGANFPRELSISAALYDLGWRGLLVEADPDLAEELRRGRPGDTVVQVAASRANSYMRFFQIPGTGLGTLDESEARAAETRGFHVVETTVPTKPLDDVLSEHVGRTAGSTIHVLTIDVEGAEADVLSGLSLDRHRPWVMCIEAIDPGIHQASHHGWEPGLLARGYRFVAFDGINRWYVADERADSPVSADAGAAAGTTIAEAIATPFHALDVGVFGWRTAREESLRSRSRRSDARQAWQREIVLNDVANQVRSSEYEKRIVELDATLSQVQGSRTFALSRQLTRAGKKVVHTLRRLRSALPTPLDNRIIRARHLKHVTANMSRLTDPSYLGEVPEQPITWVANRSNGQTARPSFPAGLDLHPLTETQLEEVGRWLHDHPFDHDDELDARMDNLNDEVGRVRAALRTRMQIAQKSLHPTTTHGSLVAFDARALQSPAFGTRGIGRFAAATLAGVRTAVGDERITLVIDPGLHRLPLVLAGACRQVSRITASDVGNYGLLIEPSPMTHSPDPVAPLLMSDVYSLAVVFDFIPRHYPNVYLSGVAQRAEYAACLDALQHYRDFLCISQLVSEELAHILARAARQIPVSSRTVAWPRDLATSQRGNTRTRNAAAGPIVLMTGDEPRKNTFGGLAGIAAATSDEAQRDVVVVGMAGQNVRVHHWSIAAAMRPGEAHTLGRVSDEELRHLLESASLVVVPTFDEGLSLPVIEAAQVGVPVVASDIPAHRELLGSGPHLFDPAKPASIASAVRKMRGSSRLPTRQARKLATHQHSVLEDEVGSRVRAHLPQDLPAKGDPARSARKSGSSRLRVAVATPWEPQRSGVADYSTTTFTELAKFADLTVFTTADARVDASTGIQQRHCDELFANPDAVAESFDAVVAVVGNSHFHLPFVEMLQHIDAIVIAHDTRMVEFYMALRGEGGVQQLMLTTTDPAASRIISSSLDDQIADMRLLQNAAMWEVANRAEHLVLHSPSAAPLISEQTGVSATVLPFANYRAPADAQITEQMRQDARTRLGLSDYPEGTVHLGSFGYIDIRTKMTDVVVETAAWLRQWGHPVALHLIGSATPPVHEELLRQAQSAGLEHMAITGYQSEEQFRDWLLGVDLGLQLRVSPMLGVSGPLSDLAAYGTPAVASAGLCVDVDTPEFIHRLPDVVSPVIVAEAIEDALRNPMPAQKREHLRLDYLQRKSPARYAEQLLQIIEQVRSKSRGPR